MGQDSNISSGRNLSLGYNKEAGFKQGYEFGLGQGIRLRYLGHRDKPLETVTIELCLLPFLFFD